jgi:NADH-quinone oxidoreductase subunit H
VVAFAILLIANIAEVNRTPFDLPEAESEIIAGYHTEYSGMRFGLFFLAEYLSVFGVSCLGTLLFLGGGALPFTEFPASLVIGNPNATWQSYVLVNLVLVTVFALKVGGFIFVMFWIRATLPRMRVDRLMNFAWKYLVPMSIINILAAAIWFECYIRTPRQLNWVLSSLITAAILIPAFLVIVAINRREKALMLGADATAAGTGGRLPAAAR